jgi:hypothetical protein
LANVATTGFSTSVYPSLHPFIRGSYFLMIPTMVWTKSQKSFSFFTASVTLAAANY